MTKIDKAVLLAAGRGTRMREMTADDIRQRLSELREELFNLRFRNSMRQLDNPLKIRAGRREIARLLTVLREKEGNAE